MGRHRQFDISHWLRSSVPFESYHIRREMDRIPGLLWRWERLHGRGGKFSCAKDSFGPVQ